MIHCVVLFGLVHSNKTAVNDFSGASDMLATLPKLSPSWPFSKRTKVFAHEEVAHLAAPEVDLKVLIAVLHIM